jgi:RNA polymerase-interacting CarD/CdnL/TRCF family regulator
MEVKATVDEAIGIAQEISGFWGKLASMFGGAPKPTQSKPLAKKKEKFVAVDETKLMSDVVKQLTEFFKLQEQLAAHIREAEQKSRTVYDPTQNDMEAALNRVMAMDQMAALEITIRETMVYQSPPEMGALYSKVFEMRDIIGAEQEAARIAQEQKEKRLAWQRHRREADQNLKAGAVVLALILIAYLWTWFLWLNQWRTT